MPRRRPLTVALAAVVLALAPGAAHASTSRELKVDTLVGPNGDVPCRVDATLYTPSGASKANPVPAILATNGFGGDKTEFAKLGAAYADRGYAFLAYTGLGFPDSGCKIELDDPDYDGKAGSQLVSYLGGSKADTDGKKIDYIQRDTTSHDGVARGDDPRVGMIGGSYGGQIQFAIAGLDPRMDTLVPQITWNDLSYSLIPNNTDFARGVTSTTPGVAKLDWPTLFFGVGQGDGLQAILTKGDTTHAGTCPNFDDRACSALATSAAIGYPDGPGLTLLRHASVSNYVSQIRIPTFLAQGEHDTLFDLQEAVATYKSLRAQNTPVKMLWRSAGHSGGSISGESNSTAPEKAYESRMALEWFDFYLRGLGEAPKLDLSFFQDHVKYSGDAAPAVGSVPSYPAGTDRSLFLSGTSDLVPAQGEVKPGAPSMAAAPAAPTGSGGAFQDSVPAGEAPGTSTSFTTKPLEADTVLAGIPQLTLTIDAPTFAQTQSDPAGKLVLFAKLYDVAPGGGTATLPADLLSAARIGDVTKTVRIELPGIVHSFAKGHTMRLTLATSNATNKGNNAGGPVTIKVDPKNPGLLTVPVLGAQIGPAGSGPSGTTPFAAAKGAPAPQPAGLGAQKGAASPGAAGLPSASAACRSRRHFRIRLRRPRHDRIRSATVTVNGKRVRVLRSARRFRAPVDLRGLPKGTYRVQVTVRTRKGRTLRSARTYRTCVPKGK